MAEIDMKEKLVEVFCSVLGVEPDSTKAEAMEFVEELIAHGVTVHERGHWDIFDDGYGCELMSCSICKSEFYDGDNDTVDQPHNYCPHCGAKMMPQPPKGE